MKGDGKVKMKTFGRKDPTKQSWSHRIDGAETAADVSGEAHITAPETTGHGEQTDGDTEQRRGGTVCGWQSLVTLPQVLPVMLQTVLVMLLALTMLPFPPRKGQNRVRRVSSNHQLVSKHNQEDCRV